MCARNPAAYKNQKHVHVIIYIYKYRSLPPHIILILYYILNFNRSLSFLFAENIFTIHRWDPNIYLCLYEPEGGPY